MENEAYIVRTNAGRYFIDSDKSVYKGKCAMPQHYVGQLIGRTYDRDSLPDAEFDNGELYLSKLPEKFTDMRKSALEDIIKCSAYLILRTDKGVRVTHFVKHIEETRPSVRNRKIDA